MRLLLLWVVVVVAAVACTGVAEAKVFRKCELAKELETIHHMKRNEVKTWVCIAQYESTFNSGAIHVNWDHSKDYGLFQLNNKYWCDSDYGQNVCQLPCSAFLDGDLRDDIRCVRRIIRDTEKWKGKGTGLTAWVAYVNKCQNKNLDEYMSDCWTDVASSNIIGMTQDSSIDNTLPHNEDTRGTGGSEPIVNNARVPIKVISNMHSPYTYFRLQPSHFLANPYPFFFH